MLCLLMLSFTVNDYTENYNDSIANDKPLVVVVGADWCDSCRVIKRHIMPQILRKFTNRHFNYAEVDSDEERYLAKKILVGESIPQTIIYYKYNGEWKNKRWIGLFKEHEIEQKLDEIKDVN